MLNHENYKEMLKKPKRYFILMAFIALILLIVHYLISWIFKNDEPFFFLLAFIIGAAAITTWIFDFFERRSK